MISTESLKDSEILMKDCKKSKPAKNNSLKKLLVIKQLTHFLDKVILKDKASSIF